jgi:hypothetical protein
VRASPRPEAVAVHAERRVDDRLQHLQQGLLDQPIHHRRNAQLPRPAVRLGYRHAAHRTGPVAAVEQCLPDVGPRRSSGTLRVCCTVRPSTPALPLLALTRFHAAAMFCRSRARASRPSVPGSFDRVAPAALHPVRLQPRLHLGLPPHFPPCRASDACLPSDMSRHRPSRSALRVAQLLRPLLTSRSGSPPSPFQAQGEISPGKNAILPRTAAGFTPPDPWPRELRSLLPARPDRHRLISGSCPSARGFAPRFLPTLGRPHAVALRFARCGQLRGTCTPRSRPCWA